MKWRALLKEAEANVCLCVRDTNRKERKEIEESMQVVHLHFSLSPVSSPSIFCDVFLPCSSFSSISPVHLSLPCHPVTTLSLAAPQPADPSRTQGLFLCYSVCAQLRAKVSTPNYKGDGEEENDRFQGEKYTFS